MHQPVFSYGDDMSLTEYRSVARRVARYETCGRTKQTIARLFGRYSFVWYYGYG